MNENVVFKEIALDVMQTGIGSRRIKMKPVSMDQLLHKVAKYSPVSVSNTGIDMEAPVVTQPSSVSVAAPVSNVQPVNIIKPLTLDDIEIRDISDFFSTRFPSVGYQPIRLTDSMYEGARISIDKRNSTVVNNVADFPFTAPISDSVVQPVSNDSYVTPITIDTSAVDTQKIQDSVTDAFNIVEENVKKVGYSNSKAKVEKYNDSNEPKREIPKFGHINDGIFASVSNDSISEVVNTNSGEAKKEERVVPVVAPVREEKVMELEENKNPEVQQFVFEPVVKDIAPVSENKPEITVASSDSNVDADSDIIDFARAKAIIEEEKKKAASLDEQKQKEEQKLEAAVKNCEEQRADYKKVCQQVKEEIAFWQKANEDRQQEVQQLEEKRLQQEKIAADYAQQKAEITSLISGTMSYGDSAQYVKQRAA